MSITDTDTNFDLIVVGGGPAGSTLAAFVAMQGHSVLLLEKEMFPRHQIGESLLPATIHGICPLLGVSEQIEQANFMRKMGGTFRWGKSNSPWTFNFAASTKMSGPTGYAYQVERSKFDEILLRNAEKKGVKVLERAAATNIVTDRGRVCGVCYIDDAGNSRTARGKYVADTSGNSSRIYQNVGQRIYSKFFENVALFGYYKNGKRLPAPNQGNILCAAFDGGWFWYIPLTNDLTSVGAVVSRERAGQLRDGREQNMRNLIESCTLIKEYLKDAERITDGPYGKLRVRMDYSYSSTRFWSPGMLLVGDSACFVDPVFSSGVHLATYSALLAARSVNSCLRGTVDEDTAFAEFEKRYRREYANFYSFLVAFYDLNQDEESYYWSARKVLGSNEETNEAFIQLVAGVGSSSEPLFQKSDAFFANMRSVSDSFQSAASVPGEFDQTKLDRPFMTSLTKEINHVQLQAILRGKRTELPLWPNGLIPTADGFHWCSLSL
jgi:halogenation protein CepH